MGGGAGSRGASFCVLLSLKSRMRAAHGRVARTKLTRILGMSIVVNTTYKTKIYAGFRAKMHLKL
jgi:hypothetical protein